MATRLVALVAQSNEPPRVRHFRGMPPELTEGLDERETLPWPRVVFIDERTKNTGNRD
jgi:hypothetical protein